MATLDESIERYARRLAEEILAPFHRDWGIYVSGYEAGVSETNKLARQWIIRCGLVAFLGGLVAGLGIMLLIRG